MLSVAALPTLSLAAAGLFDHTVVIFGLGASSSRERQVLRGHSDAVTAPAWASSASQLASGSADCTVIVWQLTDESLLVPAEPRRCMLEGHTDTIRTLCWLSDDILASGSLDHTTRLWRLENQDDQLSGECFQCLVQSLRSRSAQNVCQTMLDCWSAVQLTGRSVHGIGVPAASTWWQTSSSATTSASVPSVHCQPAILPQHRQTRRSRSGPVIQDLSGAGFDCLQTLRGHTDSVHALSYIDSKGWLASGGSDKTVRLWRVDEARIVGCSPDGHQHSHRDRAARGTIATEPTTQVPKPLKTAPPLSAARSTTPPRMLPSLEYLSALDTRQCRTVSQPARPGAGWLAKVRGALPQVDETDALLALAGSCGPGELRMPPPLSAALAVHIATALGRAGTPERPRPVTQPAAVAQPPAPPTLTETTVADGRGCEPEPEEFKVVEGHAAGAVNE